MKNQTLRVLTSFAAIIIPVLLLFKGIYGSFIFTFSIPLLWQLGFLGKPISSLGVKPDKIKASILIGVITGCLLGFSGGIILKSLGITGYIYNSLHKMQFSNMSFPLQKEVGYRLLTISDNTTGLCLYLIFSLFIIGFGEELFWRGFIQQKISGRTSADIAIWITAILFSAIHFYIFAILPIKAGIIFLLLIAFAGIVWGYLLKYFGNIWSSAISHGITAFIIWKYYFFK
ncbi:MAG: type II CAAX endopeptidase family protein [Candidatus Omnitrophica bacterium]|nr:type II CAAX endopeptidase family protein [Candidatus Omnitrophota bacterium]